MPRKTRTPCLASSLIAVSSPASHRWYEGTVRAIATFERTLVRQRSPAVPRRVEHGQGATLDRLAAGPDRARAPVAVAEGGIVAGGARQIAVAGEDGVPVEESAELDLGGARRVLRGVGNTAKLAREDRGGRCLAAGGCGLFGAGDEEPGSGDEEQAGA